MSGFVERINDRRASLQTALDAHQGNIWTALPGIVKQVDLTKMTCQVQPAIQAVEPQTDGTLQNVTLPVLVDVPIVFMHGGKYAHTFPVTQDDEVLVVFASRCIDNWWQNGGVQPQFEQRLHDLSDAIAVVGPYSQQNKLSKVSTDTSQWRNADGDIYAEVDDAKQKIRLIVKGLTVEVDAQNSVVNVMGCDKVTVNANSTVDITAPSITVHGNLDVTGNLRWNTGSSPTNATSHRHTAVSSGTATSGPPQPGS